ncbi:MAG: hypothetical protein ACO3PB_03335 [Miltoncostaeaceae bacterium]
MSIPPWARWALAVVLVLGIAAGGGAANLAVLGTTEDDTALGNLSAGSIAQQGASDGPGAPGAPGTPIPPGAVVDGPPTDTPRGEEAEGDDESGSDQRDDDQDDDREDDRDDD